MISRDFIFRLTSRIVFVNEYNPSTHTHTHKSHMHTHVSCSGQLWQILIGNRSSHPAGLDLRETLLPQALRQAQALQLGRAQQPQCSGGALHTGWNCGGGGIRGHIDLNISQPGACCAACAALPVCEVWTVCRWVGILFRRRGGGVFASAHRGAGPRSCEHTGEPQRAKKSTHARARIRSLSRRPHFKMCVFRGQQHISNVKRTSAVLKTQNKKGGKESPFSHTQS